MIDQSLFNQIKTEAKIHTVTYILTKYDMLGVSLTDTMIAQIKASPTFKYYVQNILQAKQV